MPLALATLQFYWSRQKVETESGSAGYIIAGNIISCFSKYPRTINHQPVQVQADKKAVLLYFTKRRAIAGVTQAKRSTKKVGKKLFAINQSSNFPDNDNAIQSIIFYTIGP